MAAWRGNMTAFKHLSRTQCVLLAASLACDSSIDALRAVTLARPDVFDAILVYRLILSFLPETTEPAHYVGYLTDVAERRSAQELDGEILAAAGAVDLTQIADISPTDADSRLRQLPLRPLRSSFGSNAAATLLREAPDDPLVHFLLSRSFAIDRETGLISMIPRLLRPFLHRSRYLRTWYVSNVLTLLRYENEYYSNGDGILGLDFLYRLDEQSAIGTLMSKSLDAANDTAALQRQVGRDLRGMVGPWTFGSSQRKRRKLGIRPLPLNGEELLRKNAQLEGDNGLRCKISKCNKLFEDENAWRGHVEESHQRIYNAIKQDIYNDSDAPNKILRSDGADYSPTAHRKVSWQQTMHWLLGQALDNFEFAVAAIDGWDGPNDVDLGDADADEMFANDAETAADYNSMYCQTILACVYANKDDRQEAIQGAHACLVRLAELLDFVPPPDLVTSVDLLPRIEKQSMPLESYAKHMLQYENLLLEDQPLTMPNLESYALLQMLTYSAYQLHSLGYPVSISHVAKICFWSDSKDVLSLLQTVLAVLLEKTKPDPDRWTYNRSILLYLWNWALPVSRSGEKAGYGVFGKIQKAVLEQAILKTMLAAGQFDVVRQIYLDPVEKERPLGQDVVESSVLEQIYALYDAASNGNRTRGSMKSAGEVVSAFQKSFPASKALQKAQALITATHALSFYSLHFESGVPMRPARVREAGDAMVLITKLLAQNPHSYTKLDDLQIIARNLTLALPPPAVAFSDFASLDAITDEEARLHSVARRVTGAAIEAALSEDDFETAYSYVVTRMSPSPHEPSRAGETDDISWRAAYAAGKHRAATASDPARQARRLEQRLDLLAQALALAPASSTPEVLAAWRRAEEELLTLLASNAADDTAADAAAEKRLSSGARTLPGGFGDEALDPRMSVQPSRKEMGRGAVEEAPMGLFDVARGAARAFGRTVEGHRRAASRAPAEPAVTAAAVPSRTEGEEEEEQDAAWDDWGEEGQEEERVRKRDMVASSFARGVGWVLGATPVDEHNKG